MHESIHAVETAPVQSDDRRHTLILAAYQSIAEKGFEGLRTRDVATQVGIHSATLHHYFPTKEALIQDVVEYVVQRLILTTTTSQGTAHEQLRSYLALLQQQMHQEPTLFVVLTEIALRARRDATLRTLLQQKIAGQQGFFVHLLQAGTSERDWNLNLDVEATALAISIFIQGMGLRLPLPLEEIKRAFSQLEHWLSL